MLAVDVPAAKMENLVRKCFKKTILANLDNCLELTSAELDIVILANIQASTPDDHEKPGQK